MKRPKIKQDALTQILRGNLTVPASREPSEPDPDHAWHSCYAVDDAESVPGSKPTATLEPTPTQADATYSQAAKFLFWLRTMTNTDLVYCSGHYVQHLAREFLGPGPNFCVAGTLTFVVAGTKVSADKLYADLLERPWTVASSLSLSQELLAQTLAKPDQMEGTLHSGNGWSEALQQSPRIRVPYGVTVDANTSTECTGEAAYGQHTGCFDSATILISGDTNHPPAGLESIGDRSHLDTRGQEMRVADLGRVAASESIRKDASADLEKRLACPAGSGHGVCIRIMLESDLVLEMVHAVERLKAAETGHLALHAGPARTAAESAQDCLAAAVERVAINSFAEFQVSRHYLTQRLEWLDGLYLPIGWTNVLHPACQVTLSVPDALHGVTDTPMFPEVCLNR